MSYRGTFKIVVLLFIIIVVLFLACIYKFGYSNSALFLPIYNTEQSKNAIENKNGIIENADADEHTPIIMENAENKENETTENKTEYPKEEKETINFGYIETISNNEAMIYLGDGFQILTSFSYSDNTYLLLKSTSLESGSTFILYSVKDFELIENTIVSDVNKYQSHYYTQAGVVFVFLKDNVINLYLFNGYNLVKTSELYAEQICSFKQTENGYSVVAKKGENLVLMYLKQDMNLYSSSYIGVGNEEYITEFSQNDKRYILTSSAESGTIYEIYNDAYILNTYKTKAFIDFAISYIDGKTYLCLVEEYNNALNLTFLDDSFNEYGTYIKSNSKYIKFINLKGSLLLTAESENGVILYSFYGHGLEKYIEYIGIFDVNNVSVYSGKIIISTENGLYVVDEKAQKITDNKEMPTYFKGRAISYSIISNSKGDWLNIIYFDV